MICEGREFEPRREQLAVFFLLVTVDILFPPSTLYVTAQQHKKIEIKNK